METWDFTAKSIIDKADSAMIVSRPTKQEFKKIDYILRGMVSIGKPQPNICISVYKNRGGKYNNVKIWLYIDYDTMRVSDLFITDYDCNLLPIEQKWTRVDENQNIIVYTNKDELIRDTLAYEEGMDILDVPTDIDSIASNVEIEIKNSVGKKKMELLTNMEDTQYNTSLEDEPNLDSNSGSNSDSNDVIEKNSVESSEDLDNNLPMEEDKNDSIEKNINKESTKKCNPKKKNYTLDDLDF